MATSPDTICLCSWFNQKTKNISRKLILFKDAAMEPESSIVQADPPIYEIVRMYSDINKANKIIKTRVSLSFAQRWCRNPETRGDGWFDGYGVMKSYRKQYAELIKLTNPLDS